VRREEFRSPRRITPCRLATDTRLPHQRITEVVNAKRGTTAEADLHLRAYFGPAPGCWLRAPLA